MLAETQARLESHFAALARIRHPFGYPVYALEHGLAPCDIDALRQALGRAKNLRQEHWLLWITVATEAGYTYDGDEYWQSFTAEMPSWPTFGRRETIRDWFKFFGTRFSGFSPIGRWAEHFSIIAWPITHSILPRYLQAHFAEHLYDIRYDLATKNNNIEVNLLGELLRDKYHGGSSRFSDFLQQIELTGRLVLALRDDDVQDVIPPVGRETLSRIVADLEHQRSARNHLREARQVLREARLRAGAGLVGRASAGRAPGDAKAGVAGIGQVRLAAHRSEVGQWAVGVSLPDFSEILNRAGLRVERLNQSRVRFTDQPDRWQPARALLAVSRRDYPIRCLPDSDRQPLLQIEPAIDELSGFLFDAVSLQGGPLWLLRVHEDGVARQVLGNHVRAKQAYLIVSRSALGADFVSDLGLHLQTCQTTGIQLYQMDMPPVVTDRHISALHRLGLGYALRARVEPVGLLPRWDGSIGGSVWLPTETIILRLSADFDVTGYGISIDGRDAVLITTAGNADCLVSLGTLPVGQHVVAVTAIGRRALKPGSPARATDPERAVLEVRPPHPWREGVRRQAGFRLLLEPPGAKIDDLQRGKAQISILGPEGRTASLAIRIFDTNGYPVEDQPLGRVALPADRRGIQRLIDKLLAEPLSEKVQEAPRIDVIVTIDELGAASVAFHQIIQPLRWKLEVFDGLNRARLVDETGVGQDAVVEHYRMERPDDRTLPSLQDCLQGLAVYPPGGLFVARHNKTMYAAMISVVDRGRILNFSDLGFTTTLVTPSDSPRAIPRLLAIHRRWRIARPLGTLAIVRKGAVLDALEYQIAKIACGTEWARVARDYREGQVTLLDDLQRSVGGSPGFASRVRGALWNEMGPAAARSEFARLAGFYQVSDDPELCAVAWRLAFDLSGIRSAGSDRGIALFGKLSGNRALARGAYLAAIAVSIESHGAAHSVEAAAS
jgi:hypothetical protein